MKQLFLLLVLLGTATCSFAQNVENDKREIIHLRQMPGAVDKVRESIKATNFGPFRIEGKCGYDSHWYCFGNCREWTWWWNFPNFAWLKDELEYRYAAVSNTASSFDAHFAPVKNWLLGSLPRFLESFRSEQMAIKEFQSAYISHANNPAEQENDKANILAAIKRINDALVREQETITQGIRNLSSFSQSMNRDLSRIKDLQQTMEQSIQSNQNHVRERTEGYPCDRDYARNRATEIQNSVRDQFNRVLSNAESFGLNAQGVDASSSVLIADLIIIQNKYQGAIATLQKAGESPNTVIQNLNLEITLKFYQDLAAFAREQFQ
jgi:hypothetical protein